MPKFRVYRPARAFADIEAPTKDAAIQAADEADDWDWEPTDTGTSEWEAQPNGWTYD